MGGATFSEEILPGFTISVFSYVVSLLRPQIIDDLDLARHGLQLQALDGTFTPLRDGRALTRWHDPAKTRESLLQFSRRDADNYPVFGLRMHDLSRAIRDLLMMRPPRVGSVRPRELRGLVGLASHFAGLGDRRFHELARLMTASASDYLDRWFETDVLKATMSASGIIGTFLGISSPGTAYVLLHHYMGEIDGASRSWGFQHRRHSGRRNRNPRRRLIMSSPTFGHSSRLAENRHYWDRANPRRGARTFRRTLRAALVVGANEACSASSCACFLARFFRSSSVPGAPGRSMSAWNGLSGRGVARTVRPCSRAAATTIASQP